MTFKDDNFVQNTDRAVMLLTYGASDKGVQDRLISDGVTPSTAALITVGAKLMMKWRKEIKNG